MARAENGGVRGPHGVCISIRPSGDKLELTLDTVSLSDPGSRTWRRDVFVTFVDIDIKEAKSFRSSEERLANFGDWFSAPDCPGPPSLPS